MCLFFKLEYLNISNNLLQGTLANAIFECKMLKRIDLSQNTFNGAIPPNIGGLASLRIVRLNENKLSGSIPVELFNAKKIEELIISSNELTGSIPTQVGNLQNSTILTFNHNSFKGVIPNELRGMQHLKLLHLHHNQLTGKAPQMTFRNITKDTFITDCGHPSYLLGEAVECKTCTMCCNSEDVCQEKIEWKLSTPLISIIFSIAVPIGLGIVIFFIVKTTAKFVLWDFMKERSILLYYSADSVYCFIFTNSPTAGIIYFMTAAIQICLFAAYLNASSMDFFFSSNAYPFICPDNSFECEPIHFNFVGIFGWILFFVVTVLYLAKDVGMSLIQITKGTTLTDYRLMMSGIVLLSLTILASFTSYVYNASSVETTADLITNAVILFFINDIDERVMSALNVLVPDWTGKQIDDVKRNLMTRSGIIVSDATNNWNNGRPDLRRSDADRTLPS